MCRGKRGARRSRGRGEREVVGDSGYRAGAGMAWLRRSWSV